MPTKHSKAAKHKDKETSWKEWQNFTYKVRQLDLIAYNSATLEGRSQWGKSVKCWGKVTTNLEYLYTAKQSFKSKVKMKVFSVIQNPIYIVVYNITLLPNGYPSLLLPWMHKNYTSLHLCPV